MAKKAKAVETVEVAPQEVAVKTASKPTEPTWEIKDRVYYLTGRKSPLTLTIPGKHTRKHACLLYTSPSPRDRTRSRMPSSA